MPVDQIRIGLLGPLEVTETPGIAVNPRSVPLTAAKLRQVLAILAANANSPVTTDQLVDELWPEGPPNTVRTIVQTYIYQLRKLFGKTLPPRRDTTLLVTLTGGYMMTLPHDNVDIFRFEQMMSRGKHSLQNDKPTRAADLLREALSLWRGMVLADVPRGPSLGSLAVYLEEQRLEAVSLRIDADLANNRHREVIGELRRLVADHQLHESFHMRLMQALHRSGRRGDALTVYHELRQTLDQDLGLEPSSEAQMIQREILESSR